MKLKDTALLFTDGSWIESKDQSSQGIRLIQTGNIGEGKYIEKSDRKKWISSDTFKRLGCEEVYPGDILISRLPDPIGRACIIPETGTRMITAVDCTIYRTNPDIINKKYANYFLRSKKYYQQLGLNIKGATRQRVSRKNLEKIDIDVPNFDTQLSVANALDKVEHIIDDYNKELKDLDALVKSRFVEMFGDPISNNRNWKHERLSEVCLDIKGGGTPSKSNPEYFKGDIPWVSPKDMKTTSLHDSKDHITEEAIQHSTTNIIPANSVLMVIRSGVLKHDLPVAINAVPVTINQDMKAFIPGKNITSEYLMYYFKAIEPDVLKTVRAVTADNIDFKVFQKRMIIMPPIDLQNKFSDFVNQVNKSKLAIQKSLDETQLLFDSLMQQYFG